MSRNRERTAVEPTIACSAQPTTSFGDWGIHRDTSTPLATAFHALAGALVLCFGWDVVAPDADEFAFEQVEALQEEGFKRILRRF